MAFSAGALVELTMVARVGSNRLMNVFGYEVVGSFPGVTGVQLGEAWWNDVKTVYRSLVYATAGWVYESVLVRELNNPVGELAEFTVPLAEQQGTRTAPANADFLPIFNSVGVRLAVGTRTTRPGQKRVWGLTESDNDSNILGSVFKGIVTTWATHMVSNIILGSPATAMEIDPQVFRKDAAGAVIAQQPVTGFVVSDIITSQVSRRLGRGM